MMQPALEQSMSFVEFTDSVFSELYHWETEYSYLDMKELADWKNTLIPLGINLYELTQTDDAVYWWLLQLLSHVDVCKDCKEDFRKYEVFDVLSKLKREHQKIILDKCVPNHVEELQKALDDDAFDTFKSILPRIDVDDAIYKIGRVLKRAMDVHNIYERTMSHTKGDSLAILFVLFRRCYEYFANAYDNNHRSCDGIAKNIFLALYQTQYREDNNEFCELTYNIGKLWVKSIILACIIMDNVPISLKQVMIDNVQNKNIVLYKKLEADFKKKCDTEKQEEEFIKEKGGWFEIENYSFIYNVLKVSKEIRSKTTPPFSCLCTDKKKKRKRISCNAEHCDNRDKIRYKDNYVPYIESNNAIPLEDLKIVETVKTDVVLSQIPVAVDSVSLISDDHDLAVNHSGLSDAGKKWKLQKYLNREISLSGNYCVGLKQSIVDKGDGKLTKFIKGIAEMGFIDDTPDNMNAFAFILTGRPFQKETGTVKWRKDYKKIGDNEGLYILLWMSLRMFEEAPYGQKYSQLFDALDIANNFKNPSASADHHCIEGFRNLVKECFNMDA